MSKTTKKSATIPAIPLPVKSRGKSVLEQMRENHQGEHADDDRQRFLKRYATLPDATTATGYTSVPIENFGAAMLRGMGWHEPCTNGCVNNQ